MTAIPFAGLGPHADYPRTLVADTEMRGGLRYTALGEDAEHWVFLGHAYHRDVLAAIELINREDRIGYDEDGLPDREDLIYTYARLIESCPEHTKAVDDCATCSDVQFLDPGGWYLDWSGGGEDGKANKGEPGYFPVVLWEVDQ